MATPVAGAGGSKSIQAPSTETTELQRLVEAMVGHESQHEQTLTKALSEKKYTRITPVGALAGLGLDVMRYLQPQEKRLLPSHPEMKKEVALAALRESRDQAGKVHLALQAIFGQSETKSNARNVNEVCEALFDTLPDDDIPQEFQNYPKAVTVILIALKIAPEKAPFLKALLPTIASNNLCNLYSICLYYFKKHDHETLGPILEKAVNYYPPERLVEISRIIKAYGDSLMKSGRFDIAFAFMDSFFHPETKLPILQNEDLKNLYLEAMARTGHLDKLLELHRLGFATEKHLENAMSSTTPNSTNLETFRKIMYLFTSDPAYWRTRYVVALVNSGEVDKALTTAFSIAQEYPTSFLHVLLNLHRVEFSKVFVTLKELPYIRTPDESDDLSNHMSLARKAFNSAPTGDEFQLAFISLFNVLSTSPEVKDRFVLKFVEENLYPESHPKPENYPKLAPLLNLLSRDYSHLKVLQAKLKRLEELYVGFS